MPRTSCVRSLLPIEKPSNRSAKSSARITFEGISAITQISRPSRPRSRPSSFRTASTASASSGVRQKGIITMRLSRPTVSRTRRIARHSRAKPSR